MNIGETNEDVLERLPSLNEYCGTPMYTHNAKDFMLLDDAMLYDEKDRYEDCVARLGPNAVPSEYRKILDKTIELFKDTHTPQVITIAQGFLALHPK